MRLVWYFSLIGCAYYLSRLQLSSDSVDYDVGVEFVGVYREFVIGT